jgi:hypothetical protein
MRYAADSAAMKKPFQFLFEKQQEARQNKMQCERNIIASMNAQTYNRL